MKRDDSRLSPCAALVRQHDPDRFFCALFAPAQRREALFALAAFETELARIPARVSEPMLGAIRLQWWRESLEGIAAGRPRRHEVVEPLARAVADHDLDLDLLGAAIDGWEPVVAGEEPAELDDLAREAETRHAPVLRASLVVLGADAGDPTIKATAAAAARACALTATLRQGAARAEAGRAALPRGLLSRHGLDLSAMLDDGSAGRLGDAVREAADRAGKEVAAARRSGRGLPRTTLAGLLPMSFAARDLARLRRSGYNLFDPAIAHGGAGRQLAVLARALAGRF